MALYYSQTQCHVIKFFVHDVITLPGVMSYGIKYISESYGVLVQVLMNGGTLHRHTLDLQRLCQ